MAISVSPGNWGQYRIGQEVRGGMLSAESSWYIQPHADQAAKALAAAFPATGPASGLQADLLLKAVASVCAQDGPQ
ncbi:hypothetical protein [Stenotrophomonas maltophilia]|uniref:hypothetical protein n=1 Tax=Stenotrophomonas maltophilia TaxID=40324 RepID=UPI001EF97EF2|nr:hypothetical protein [Stenotrophomonas maltophilia]